MAGDDRCGGTGGGRISRNDGGRRRGGRAHVGIQIDTEESGRSVACAIGKHPATVDKTHTIDIRAGKVIRGRHKHDGRADLRKGRRIEVCRHKVAR